jgi:hypothetical protein
MSFNDANERKRKPTIIPDTVSSNSGRNPKEQSKKARKASTKASPSTAASLQVDTPVAAEEAATEIIVFSAADEQEESIERIGALIQDLSHPDDAKVNAALGALYPVLVDTKKREICVAAGGYLALVQLVKNCLDKAIDEIPSCDQVTELDELDELKTLHKTLDAIISLIYLDENKAALAISSVGGVEAVAKVMKTFPKCLDLQWSACAVLGNMSFCNLGEKKAVASGGLQLLLAAVNNHLDSSNVCEYACSALYNIIAESKEHTELLIILGGGAAIAKVRKEWPSEEDVQSEVQRLAKLLAAEMNSWVT